MQNFSTIPAIIDEAGFTENENISPAKVQSYMDEASAVVQSYVSKKYDLVTMLASSKFTGSQAAFYLEQCERLYAAGSLLNKEYGYQSKDEETGTGDPKIERALDMLANVTSGAVLLIDTDGAEFADSNARSNLKATGFPISSTVETADGRNLSRKFSMNDSIT